MAHVDAIICACIHVLSDITIGGKAAGRITMELRGDVVPKTAGQSLATRPSALLLWHLLALWWLTG